MGCWWPCSHVLAVGALLPYKRPWRVRLDTSREWRWPLTKLSIVAMVTFSTASLWWKFSSELFCPTHFIDFSAKIISKQLTRYRCCLVTTRGKLGIQVWFQRFSVAKIQLPVPCQGWNKGACKCSLQLTGCFFTRNDIGINWENNCWAFWRALSVDLVLRDYWFQIALLTLGDTNNLQFSGLEYFSISSSSFVLDTILVASLALTGALVLSVIENSSAKLTCQNLTSGRHQVICKTTGEKGWDLCAFIVTIGGLIPVTFWIIQSSKRSFNLLTKLLFQGSEEPLYLSFARGRRLWGDLFVHLLRGC